MKRRVLSNRALLVVVSVLTLILLIGSTILQRIVFKAQESYQSLYLTTPQNQVGINQSITLDLSSTFDQPTTVIGLQTEILFDERLAKFEEIIPMSEFDLIDLQQEGGKIKIALGSRSASNGGTLLKGEATLAQIVFRALSLGTLEFSLEPSASRLAAFDRSASGTLYNSVNSLQSTSVVISNTAVKTKQDEQIIPTEVAREPDLFSTQRIISEEVIAYANSAVVLTRFQYPAQLKVEFGETQSLGSVSESFETASAQSLRLSGLKEGTRYYWRIIVINPDDSSTIKGRLKSFTTLMYSTTGQVNVKKSILKIFPTPFKSNGQVYIQLLDNEGRLVKETEPNLQVREGHSITLTSLNNTDGLISATVFNHTNRRQIATIDISIGEEKITAQSISDPRMKENKVTELDLISRVTWGTNTAITLLVLFITIIVLSFAFVKVARLR